MYSSPRAVKNDVILYVEDDEISRKSLSLIIKRRYPGITLLLAGNGREGLALFELERPGLVISDIVMPIMDGIQMIKEIREISTDTGIIVTSASCDLEPVMHAIGLDSRFYLCKPIDISKLFNAIDEWLAVQDMIKDSECSALAG